MVAEYKLAAVRDELEGMQQECTKVLLEFGKEKAQVAQLKQELRDAYLWIGYKTLQEAKQDARTRQ